MPLEQACVAEGRAAASTLLSPDLCPIAAEQPQALPPAVSEGKAAAARRIAGGAAPRSTPRARIAVPSAAIDAVASAVAGHSEIRAGQARVREAQAGVTLAQTGLFPTFEGRVAGGAGRGGSESGASAPFDAAVPGSYSRGDGALMLRQLLFDFGATARDVERARLVNQSEALRLQEKVDEIAYRTLDAYLRVLQSRQVLALVDELLARHRELQSIVAKNQAEGNTTAADVNRVNSRIVDIGAIRADAQLQVLAAEELFDRLTRTRPSRLAPFPSLRAALPPSPDAALALAEKANPKLAAIVATSRSIDSEIEFQRRSALPKVHLEVDAETKTYREAGGYRSENDLRSMVALRYKFLDGGLTAATVNQLVARREGSEASRQNERDQLGADVRQAYRAVASSALKVKLVREGVAAAASVEALYLEQFRAGRRTVFELLDSKMSAYTIRRTAIESGFDGLRAELEILRATGTLTTTILGM